MENNKIQIAVIFGGKSAEHQISLISAFNIMKALDKDKYEIKPIGISREGAFYSFGSNPIINESDPQTVSLNKDHHEIAFVKNGYFDLSENKKYKIDIAFPIIHGTNGEDGTLQGLLKMSDIPFVGPDTLGSAICMDKDITKRLLLGAKIPISDFVTLRKGDDTDFEALSKQLDLPLFIKPANAGSSVGVSKIKDESEFKKAITEAFRYDKKILIEKAIVGREIECSILGNEEPKASLPGEVMPDHEFYSYESKYIDKDGADFGIPAKLSENEIHLIQKTSIETFKALDCEGMARVDGFLTQNGSFIINEVNTLPGFTSISMYPKLWQVSGIAYSDLLDTLVNLGIDRHEREKEIEKNYQNI
jgi:D-alanine-D-alanine ligase